MEAVASTVESLDICLETVRSPRNQENQEEVAAAVVVTASTVDSQAICRESAPNPRNPENLVEAVAVTASIVVSLVTCLVNALSLESPVRSSDLEVDPLETGQLSDHIQFFESLSFQTKSSCPLSFSLMAFYDMIDSQIVEIPDINLLNAFISDKP